MSQRTHRDELHHILIGSLISIGIGVFFSSFYALGRPGILGLVLASGAITGFSIHVAIALLQFLVAPWVERLPRRPQLFAHALVFIAGGISGWIGGMTVAARLLGLGMSTADLFRGTGLFSMGVTAAIALVVGFLFYSFNALFERLKEREWAEKEMALARTIQTRLLPPPFIQGAGYSVAGRNLPAYFVAGDFYDVVPLDDGSVVIVVADVAGKGIGASLIMASVKAVLPFVSREGAARAMDALNRKLLQELHRREFVALVYARLTPADGTIQLMNAGFPDPYIVSSSGVRALAALGPRLPLGVRADIEYEPLHATLGPGEKLLFVSDGIPEAPAKGEPLGYERLSEILERLATDIRGEDWLELFLARVRENVDDALDDDWTAVVVER